VNKSCAKGSAQKIASKYNRGTFDRLTAARPAARYRHSLCKFFNCHDASLDNLPKSNSGEVGIEVSVSF